MKSLSGYFVAGTFFAPEYVYFNKQTQSFGLWINSDEGVRHISGNGQDQGGSGG
jgi:hypothetical protein